METTRQAIRPAKRPLLQFLVFIGVTLAVPVTLVRLVRPPPPEERQAEVMRKDPEAERQRLAERQPEWMLVGNSMLNSRVNQKDLNRTSGLNTMKLTEGGSQSAIWFLFLRRIVQESGVKPRWITIFFRETDLTWPDLRIGGSNEKLIKLLGGEEQPEWRRVITSQTVGAKLRDGDVGGVVSHGLTALLGAEEWREWGRGGVQTAAFEVTEFGGGVPRERRKMEMNERFSLDHLRHDLATDMAQASSTAGIVTSNSGGEAAIDVGVYGIGPKTFDSSPDVSFLPHIIAVAKEMGARMHFHRVKLRSRADDGGEDSAWMRAYMKDLRRYLESEGCALTDESDDPEITSDLYADGDHISREPVPQRRYIELFWKRVGPVIGGGTAAEETSNQLAEP